MAKRLLRPRLKKSDKAKNPTNEGAVPRITNETVAETREEVLKGARKLIYPLQHSKHKVVKLSILIGVMTALVFLAYCVLNLYRFNSASTFTYRVTQVVPFPVAKVGGQLVSYEDYLFELRQYIHYFETQEKVDFSTEQGKLQLEAQQKEALQKVIDRAYVQRLAKQNNITISAEEVDQEIELLQSQNRLGNNDAALKDVIREYYGWTMNDFRRSLSDKLLAVKVLDALDTNAKTKSQSAIAELKAGADFAAVAAKYSDDVSTKDKGGEISFLIDKEDRNVPSQMTSTLYALQPGQYSGPFSVGYGIEIVKNIENKDGKIRAAYILFNYKDIKEFVNAEKDKVKATTYLRL